ncbi:MAG: polymer-forming cytoskeletal protein [Holophagaceae bacterium]|jgi:cytoskeletal protein CcmA (bactofilin family)|nr:polymer-forming cytoskeletal protein [Holophagaceae bacterium]
MNEISEQSGSIVIGSDVSIKGVLSVPNRAVVNGTIEGELTARELIVGQTGRILGNAKSERADIHGEVHQTLVVSQSLTLRSTGKVLGVVHYAELEIEKGGLVEGKMTQQSSAAPKPPPTVQVVQDHISDETRADVAGEDQ